MMNALSANPGIDEMQLGSASLKVCLGLGVWVISFFLLSLFLHQQFSDETEKERNRPLQRVGHGQRPSFPHDLYETLYIAVISLVIGLGLGIVLDKASFLVLASLMETEVPLGFYISLTQSGQL